MTGGGVEGVLWLESIQVSIMRNAAKVCVVLLTKVQSNRICWAESPAFNSRCLQVWLKTGILYRAYPSLRPNKHNFRVIIIHIPHISISIHFRSTEMPLNDFW